MANFPGVLLLLSLCRSSMSCWRWVRFCLVSLPSKQAKMALNASEAFSGSHDGERAVDSLVSEASSSHKRSAHETPLLFSIKRSNIIFLPHSHHSPGLSNPLFDIVNGSLCYACVSSLVPLRPNTGSVPRCILRAHAW